jgi:hypothetical protein
MAASDFRAGLTSLQQRAKKLFSMRYELRLNTSSCNLNRLFAMRYIG